MWHYDDISIAIEVIRQGSFIEASKQLGIPSSTVSRRVSQLEQSIGIRLLERTSRKLSITDKGQAFFDQCAPHMQQLDFHINELIADQNSLKGKLNITAPVFLGSELLNSWFSEFIAINDQLELEVVLSNQYEDILDEKIDVAIRIGPLNDSQFIAQRLFSSAFVLCASPSFIKKLESPIRIPDDLRKQSLLLMKQNQGVLELREINSKKLTRLTCQPKVSSNDINIIRQSAISGIGVACLPKLSVKNLIDSGELMPLLSDFEVALVRDIYVLYPSKKHLPLKTRTFIEFIKQKSKEIE